METDPTKPKLMLHVCCAICGAYLTEILQKEFQPILFYHNPNIHPKEEYEKRKEAGQKLAQIYHLEFIEGIYDPDNWFKAIKGFEVEPEGGKRCPVCFKMRLLETAMAAQKRKIEIFTTTLAVSPYKNEILTDIIGEEIAKNLSLRFLKSSEFDQSKKEIWQKTRLLARKYGFYHQKYCGCILSKPTINK